MTKFQIPVEVLSRALSLMLDWRVEVATSGLNRGASLIAHSVTIECRINSYVSIGYPLWLKDLFLHESSSSLR